MDKACSTYGEMTNASKSLVGNLTARNHSEYLEKDRKIIELILAK